MKKYRQDLSYSVVSQFLAYDPLTGFLYKRAPVTLLPTGMPVGRLDTKGYLRTRIDGVDYKNHRLAWLLFYMQWPTQEIDHINGIRADNRIKNLRDVSARVNGLNRQQAMKNNVVGVLGVSPSKRGRFVVQLKVGPLHLRAECATLEEAAATYAAWKQEHTE